MSFYKSARRKDSVYRFCTFTKIAGIEIYQFKLKTNNSSGKYGCLEITRLQAAVKKC